MKLLAVLAGVVCVFAGSTLGSSASAGAANAGTSPSWSHRYTSMVLPAIGTLPMRRVFLPMQTDTTPTPSPTSGPSYPDPVSLLQKSIDAYSMLQGVHFRNTIDGEQQGTVKLHIDAEGDASCKGPSLRAHITAKESLEGTSQSKKLSYDFIQIKNTYWKKAKATHNKWTKTKAAKTAAFSFTTDNPLICPSASSGSGSGSSNGNSQLKNLLNLGPETVNGVSVWHIQATEVDVDPQSGQTTNATLDYYLGQHYPFPYKYSASIDDPKGGITLVFKQLLSKFGEKVTITSPKVGGAKP